jgi:hypothetical protein
VGVEGGVTNVCGVAPEEALALHAFEPDGLVRKFEPLRDRVSPLTRSMDWFITGPLYFRNRLDTPGPPGQYFAGDQLSFVDPFTGTGIRSGLSTGDRPAASPGVIGCSAISTGRRGWAGRATGAMDSVESVSPTHTASVFRMGVKPVGTRRKMPTGEDLWARRTSTNQTTRRYRLDLRSSERLATAYHTITLFCSKN